MITRAERGGAQSHVLELLRLKERARITVVSGEDGFLLDEARALGLRTMVVPSLVAQIDPRQDLRAVRDVARLLQRERPDLLHLHSSKAGLIGRVAARLVGVPAVFTAHGWAFTEGASPARRQLAIWSERLAAPLSAAIIAVSDYDRALSARLRVTQRARTIHNALPERHPQQPITLRAAGDRVRVLMVARFAPPKNQALLLRAAASLPETELWLIGDGPGLPEARALAEELGMQERVWFAGNRSDVGDLLASGDVFCLCSNYEGLPISILEAMRAGLPVVASDVGGVPEAVLHERTGLVVPHDDVAHWRLALTRLLDDPALRRAYGQAGREQFEAAFTTAPMLERVWSVYQDVWNQRGQS
ncbi:glycosyltransferase family 4 protein (plasmid) [Deinococcus radiomollis]|uniref:glycosyltransferase family 4 protein n=1 Tax=Deinococcus radiomollis TaxID=468916 RepID=UPI0038924D15